MKCLSRLVVLVLLMGAPAWAQEPAPAPAPPTRLSQLVAALDDDNPELQASRRDVDMAVARIRPAGAPPDPTLSLGYMGGGFAGLYRPFFPSASTQGSFQQFGASQEIPYPGKLGLRTRIAATEADRARWAYEDVRIRRAAELKEAYFEYVLADRSLAVVRRNREVLDRFRRIAEVRFSVGKAIQQDVLKAQLEISMLIERTRMLERDRVAALARLNGLLNRPSNTPVPATLTFDVRSLPPLTEMQAAVTERAPAVRRDEQVIRGGEQTLALAKKEVLPDFAVSFTSQRWTGDMPWMYGVDVMVKVPLFWQRKQRPLIAEAAAALESGRRMRESTVAMAHSGIAEEHERATTSRQLMELYGDSVLPQARLALESSLASYEVGAVDFLSVLMNFTTLLNYEVSYEQQQAMYHEALARIEPLAGVELIQ
jgi:outer membrane protein TolC